MAKIRVGFGYDVHPLAEGRKMILGGVPFSYHLGPLGHSDADVLLHAVCDALLGAANLRDIGYHFPNTDQAWHNADSLKLLEAVVKLLKEAGYIIGNVDATLVLEKPKINPRITEMQAVMAAAMGIEPSEVSIKATTSEKLGFVGNEEGVEAYCVALIEKLG